jgi:hypothetical protein
MKLNARHVRRYDYYERHDARVGVVGHGACVAQRDAQEGVGFRQRMTLSRGSERIETTARGPCCSLSAGRRGRVGSKKTSNQAVGPRSGLLPDVRAGGRSHASDARKRRGLKAAISCG